MILENPRLGRGLPLANARWNQDARIFIDRISSSRADLPLETSVPVVFAIAEVRSSSVKRVGGAIGEGAAVVAQIHAFLARRESAEERR